MRRTVSRRDLARVVTAVTLGSAGTAYSGVAIADPQPAEYLLSPVELGASVGFGWTLAALSPVDRGAAELTLRHSGSSALARVVVCRRSEPTRALATTRTLDFLLMNGAAGSKQSDERLGRAIRALAARFDSVAQPASVAHRLMTHRERVDFYGAESL